jgi:ketosteroid isomerase-like protein
VSSELEILKKKVQMLEDKDAIRDVLSRYAFNVDTNRIDHYLRLFTDDMLFVTDGPGEAIYCRSKKELGDFLREVLPKPYPGMQHNQLDYVINVDGDTAKATGYQILTLATGDKFEIQRGAMRTFKFRRVDGIWKITETISHSTANEPDCQKQIPDNW